MAFRFLKSRDNSETKRYKKYFYVNLWSDNLTVLRSQFFF